MKLIFNNKVMFDNVNKIRDIINYLKASKVTRYSVITPFKNKIVFVFNNGVDILTVAGVIDNQIDEILNNI